MYWFQKELKKEINGTTLGEWVKENIKDTHCVTVYKSTEKGYREVMHAYGVNEIQVGDLEQIKNYKIEKVITLLNDEKDTIQRYLVLIG